MTLAAVAARFDVRLPSLYKHVDGLAALRTGLSALAVRELGDVLRSAAVGKSAGDALRAMADGYRSYALRHPGRYAATLKASCTASSPSRQQEGSACPGDVERSLDRLVSGLDAALHAWTEGN